MPPGSRIAIYTTSAGFVSPSVACFAYAASNFDGDVERAFAETAQGEALPAGIYVAKWPSEHGTSEYVFTVRVETHRTHHVEVAP
jgi:hypothetical protein